MQNDIKVFSSDMTRGHQPLENNLYDLFKVVPAKPISVSNELGSDCDFKPKSHKYYIPMKKSKLKVKTIRDIRNLFEKDVYTELPNELEKQRIFLLREITAGSSRDENTKSLAKTILVHDKPISRSAWQMLMNLNPEGHSHCFQYVLWNGKRIRVNGGKGGKNKFLCNYDLGNKIKDFNIKFIGEKKTNKKKKALLQNSLSIRFKPVPLTKKNADFYNNTSLKTEYMAKKILTVVEVKLNCKNIEPWCMVHNLYKCFCKGKFTANSLSQKSMDEKDVNQTTIHKGERNDVENSINKANESEIKNTNNNRRTRPDRNSIDLISKKNTSWDSSITTENYASYYEEGNACARTKPFTERKYYNSYYLSAQNKIFEMEKNDTKLEKRLNNIIGKMDSFVEGAVDHNKSMMAYDKLYGQEIPKNKDKSSLTYGKSELQLQEINNIKVKTNVTRDKSESSHHDAAKIYNTNIVTRSKHKLPSDNSNELYGESEFHHQKVAKIKENNNVPRDKSEICDQENIHNDHHESAKINYSKNVIQDKIELHHLDLTKPNDSNPQELLVVKETDTQLSSNVNESESGRSKLNFDAKISSEPLPNKTKLIALLEASYKQYKEHVDKGKVKVALDSPKSGKVALYTWDFVLDRYKTRKNLFLVTKQKPFRIFIAIDVKSPFFENCMNIDEIRFAELYKYPVAIKHLLTNATDLKDKFCILGGLSQCWELLGSVTKLPESGRNDGDCDSISDAFDWGQTTSHDITVTVDDIKMDDVLSHASEDMEVDIQVIPSNNSEIYNDSNWSKWFMMTVENDFTEIHFYKRGFFVKYETIIKAINVARMTGETVRLIYRMCVDRCNPQFGIYAIPNANDNCVYVGPYDKEEPLGIKTVNCKTDDGKSKKTRGVWITTKKVDNVKLVDSPLSFMPANDLHPSKIVSIEGDCMSDTKNGDMKEPDQIVSANVSSSTKNLQNPTVERSTVVKPIRIHKTNGFYHIVPNGLLKQITSKEKVDSRNSTQSHCCLQQPISITKSLNINSLPIINAPPLVLNSLPSSNVSNLKSLLLNLRSDETPSPSVSLLNSTATSVKCYHNVSVEYKKPVAENAPQIKIVGVYSENGDAINTIIDANIPEGGMILKTEEINKRQIENKIMSDAKSLSLKGSEIIKGEKERDRDIENLFATSNVCTAPNTDIYIISEKEDEIEISKNLQNWQEVWITCANIENLGMLRGRQDIDKNLSFEFPGFKFTEFYPQEDAFVKINQLLSKMVYVPKNITLEWTVIDSEEEVADKLLLKLDELGTDFVLTKRGLRHKSDLIVHRESVMKSRIKEGPDTLKLNQYCNKTKHISKKEETIDRASELMNVSEEKSTSLENEGHLLLSEFRKSGELLRSISDVSEDQREHMLQCFISSQNDNQMISDTLEEQSS